MSYPDLSNTPCCAVNWVSGNPDLESLKEWIDFAGRPGYARILFTATTDASSETDYIARIKKLGFKRQGKPFRNPNSLRDVQLWKYMARIKPEKMETF